MRSTVIHPLPGPPPSRGRENRLGRLEVPSPLVGEGQGGGYAADKTVGRETGG